MLGARELVFQLRHLLLRAVEHAPEFIREAKIDSRAVNFRPTLEFARQSFAQTINRDADFLEQRLSYSVGLIEKRRKKMFIRNLLMIELRSDILRSLQRLLHLLCEPVDAHRPP